MNIKKKDTIFIKKKKHDMYKKNRKNMYLHVFCILRKHKKRFIYVFTCILYFVFTVYLCIYMYFVFLRIYGLFM